MRFNRLRLLGFKSFVEPADFIIEPGLTGIVGPNGCGKSNLVEALRWVMGENSYKNMRASGMDDVIFSGSATRPARNAAEVTLFLDAEDGQAPPVLEGAEELQVSRRIERDAGSVYRINGREARARDVQLLFADQSTGARSPSMVGQGRVSELIQAKPQARRALLEEAAGISGLHTRRHEAELRLRAAEANLERLDDVASELETQIESLKRQARQAARFRNLSAEIRQGEATLLHGRWQEARALVGESRQALNEATTVVAERAAAQMEAAKAQAVAASSLPALREAAASAAGATHRLDLAAAQLDDEEKRIGARQGDLADRLVQIGADRAREQALAADAAGVLVQLDGEEAVLLAATGSGRLREAAAEAQLAQASRRLEADEAALAAAAAAHAQAAAMEGQAQRHLAQARERRLKLERQHSQAQAEGAAALEGASLIRDLDRLRRTVIEATEDHASAEARLAEAEALVGLLRAEEGAVQPEVGEARAALARAETEAQTLMRILEGASASRLPSVLEQITVDRGFEAALGAALGEDLDAPLDPTAPAHWRVLGHPDGDALLPEGAVPLARHVRAPGALQRRLNQIGLVDREDGPALQRQLRPGQRLVSREGATWRWDGYSASAEAPTAAAQRLAQRNRLAELQEELAEAKARLQAAQARLAETATRSREGLDDERKAREAVRHHAATVAREREALLHAERAAGERDARQIAAAQTVARLHEALDETRQAEALAAAAADAIDPIAELEQARAAAGERLALSRGAHAEARLARDTLRRDAERVTQRLAAIKSERATWTARRADAEGYLAALLARETEAARELEALADAPETLHARRHALLSQVATARAAQRKAADALQNGETRQRELDRLAAGAIEMLGAARENRIRTEERLTAAEERLAEVETRIRQTLGVPPHQALALTGLEQGAPVPEAAVLEPRLERLKAERERLGAVNLRAEDEQRAFGIRLDAMVAERRDVTEAIRTLRGAIHGLNREGRERLLAAFDLVNAEFQRLFTHLFGGGEAQLQLVQSDDPLEAGLEIMARPPGKRPQTMTLLSGGEQALTALALIFAVFLTNPAPICVLDEVDAPLDDHNVERFCNLMDQMAASTETRFIVITHNPITMSRMNRLFGVTMVEQGVSQLVSVDLQAAARMIEPA